MRGRHAGGMKELPPSRGTVRLATAGIAQNAQEPGATSAVKPQMPKRGGDVRRATRGAACGDVARKLLQVLQRLRGGTDVEHSRLLEAASRDNQGS